MLHSGGSRYPAKELAVIHDSRIQPGLTAERRVVVSEAMTTTHAGTPILTAPSMIMQMELTAQDATDPFLRPERTTVGYEICITHRRATPVGEWFRVTAELTEVDDRHLVFKVEAHNAREKIGEGRLRRTIVRVGSVG
jgi:predicted thioesterase